ncbi:MAG TPA: DeoR/GlpR family DNA-binding transcription regulator [Rubrivivax sp.]|nr:DeoR/GlpR family DNA-binding transcription regulator [Rubrivivax sp.]
MWSEARHQRIRTLLQRKGQLTTEETMQELGVSRETVRRDFLALEALGLLQRVHGGAVHLSDEPPLDKRSTIHVAAKKAIARAVAQALQPPVTVFMDAGSTTTILARELARLGGITLITNSLSAAQCLVDSVRGGENQVIVLTGTLNGELFSTTGAATVLQLRRFHADVALLSPVAFNAREGAASFLRDEASIARAMCEGARQTWILADHSKLGTSSRETYCAARDVDRLFCDRKAQSVEGFEALKASVGEVVLA